MAVICGCGTALFAGSQVYKGNEKFYKEYLMPCLSRCLEPETAHNLAIFVAKNNLVPKQKYADPPSLVCENTI